MIIWHNEAAPLSPGHPAATDLPPGPIEVSRARHADGRSEIWYAPVPAIPAGEGVPDPVGMLTAMAGMHHEWYEAWQAAGFSEDQAYGLVVEVVRSAFTQG